MRGFVLAEDVGVSGLNPGGEDIVELLLDVTLKGIALAVEVGPIQKRVQEDADVIRKKYVHGFVGDLAEGDLADVLLVMIGCSLRGIATVGPPLPCPRPRPHAPRRALADAGFGPV